jgi:hypothetical protein
VTTQGLCFVIMPFSSPSGSGYSEEHFTEVYEDLFMPAISAASFSPVRADTTVLSRHILADLLARIEEAAIVLCDLSAANPNVLFELGWAFRADRLCVLVKDDLTQYPFDLQHAHVTTYHSSLKARLVKSDISEISQLVQNTAADSARRWSLVQSLGLDARLRTEAATEQDPIAAAILEIREELGLLRTRLGVQSPRSAAPSVAVESAGDRMFSPRQRQQKKEILEILEEERGEVGRAAQRLGITRARLYNLIKSLDISLGETRG